MSQFLRCMVDLKSGPGTTRRTVSILDLPTRCEKFLASLAGFTQTLQTALGPSKPRGLRPQTPPEDSGPTPPYEGPGSRLGKSKLAPWTNMFSSHQHASRFPSKHRTTPKRHAKSTPRIRLHHTRRAFGVGSAIRPTTFSEGAKGV